MRWSWISFAVGMLMSAVIAALCWLAIGMPADTPDVSEPLPERWLAPASEADGARDSPADATSGVAPRRSRAHTAPRLGEPSDTAPPPVGGDGASGITSGRVIQLDGSSFRGSGSSNVSIAFAAGKGGRFVIRGLTAGGADPSKSLLAWSKARAAEVVPKERTPDADDAARRLDASTYAEKAIGLGLALRTSPPSLAAILGAVRDESYPDLRGAALRAAIEVAPRHADVRSAILDAARSGDTALRRVAIESLALAGDDGARLAAEILLAGDYVSDVVGGLAAAVGASPLAAEFLGKSPPPDAALAVVQHLVKRLADPQSDEDRDLATSLPSLVRPLLEAPEADRHAAGLLPQLAALGHGAFLRGIAASTLHRPAVRAAAVTAALGNEATKPDGVAAIAAILADPAVDVSLVRSVLNQLGPSPWTPGEAVADDPMLRSALAAASRTHPSAWVREAARDYLAGLDAGSAGTLVIHEAIWGITGAQIDVSDAVRAAIKEGRVRIQASNDLGGDPKPGAHKSLRVEYSLGGVRRLATVGEGGMLELP